MLMLLALQTRPTPGVRATPPQQQDSAFDSTKAVIAAVGLRVAEVKSALASFRRAVFNLPDGEVLGTADLLRTRCRSLDSVAVSGARRVCRSCGSRQFRTALVAYRNVLPSLGRVGAQCAARLSRLSREKEAAKRLRQEVWAVGNPIVQGLIPYERRLAVLREAAGWAPPPGRAAPRTGARP